MDSCSSWSLTLGLSSNCHHPLPPGPQVSPVAGTWAREPLRPKAPLQPLVHRLPCTHTTTPHHTQHTPTMDPSSYWPRSSAYLLAGLVSSRHQLPDSDTRACRQVSWLAPRPHSLPSSCLGSPAPFISQLADPLVSPVSMSKLWLV